MTKLGKFLSNLEATMYSFSQCQYFRKKNYNTVLYKRQEKDALQEKKEVERGFVRGIFQTGGMTGIEALKCLGPEDKTGQRTGENLFNS